MNRCLCNFTTRVESTYAGKETSTGHEVIAATIRCVNCGWGWTETTCPTEFKKEGAA